MDLWCLVGEEVWMRSGLNEKIGMVVFQILLVDEDLCMLL